MMWLPGQAVANGSVGRRARRIAPDTVLYMLELYPNAPLQDEMARSGWSQAPDDDAADMYLEALARLEAGGAASTRFRCSASGAESRHNMKYWAPASGSGSAVAPIRLLAIGVEGTCPVPLTASD